jgi:hypothetical protein
MKTSHVSLLTALQKEGLADGKTMITTARFDRLPSSLEEMNRFTFRDKGWIHYGFFLAVIGIPLFILFALVVCVRSKIRRKWLWVVFTLLGLITLRLNWTTGQTDYQIFSFQLFGASALAAGSYAPWIFGVSLPIGAIVFLVKRSKLIANKLKEGVANGPLEPNPN